MTWQAADLAGAGKVWRRIWATSGWRSQKEAPYSIAAIGTALATDAVTATEAMLFLGGANSGAGLYEYGLGRITRRLLWPSQAAQASFASDWCPKRYLQDYYRTVEPDEAATLAAFVAALRKAPRARPVLVFGCGLMVHHACLAAPYASRIDLCDHLPANLAAVADRQAEAPSAHDWDAVLSEILRLETGRDPDVAEVSAGARLTRAGSATLTRPTCWPTRQSATGRGHSTAR